VRRRPKAGSDLAKTRRGKSMPRKRRNARKSAHGRAEDSDVTRLTHELKDARERETAAAEVLRVISSSSGNLQPVFEAILTNAVRLCEAQFGNLWLRDDDKFRVVAIHGGSPEYQKFLLSDPLIAPDPQSATARIARDRRVVQIEDMAKAPIHRIRVATVEMAKGRTLVGVPMLKNGEVIGIIHIYRQEVRLFTDKQVSVLTNFASQAVIAIENARLLNELRQRTADLTESLEQQTATSEVLHVISSSPGELEPVFATMLEKAARICDATSGNIYRWDGKLLHLVAAHNSPTAFVDETRKHVGFRYRPNDPIGRMIETKTAVHMADLAAEPGYVERSNPGMIAAVELAGIRTALAVPMLKENEFVGSFHLSRQEVRPFTDKQIELVQNFAAQAVIAIENARLLNELRHSLEQQTATADILRVISQSPTDVRPVFDSIVATAVRLLGSDQVTVMLRDGDVFSAVAAATPEGAVADARLAKNAPINASANFPSRAIVDRQMLHLPDWSLIDLPEFEMNVQRKFGIQAALYLPLLREEECIGLLTLVGKRPNMFGPAEIAQAESFRDQALIAIENTRLFNELRQRTDDLTEALEQQTATSEILQVISRSPGDLEPVFKSMLENAIRICEANLGNIHRLDGDTLHLIATRNTTPDFAQDRRWSKLRPDPDLPLGRAISTRAVIHVADAAAEEAYARRHPSFVSAVELGGVRSFLFVPMLKESEVIGVFSLARQKVQPFTDKQIALVTNFAAQAVIAIENARLLGALRERTEEVVKLNQQLERRVADQIGEIERMGRLRRFLPPQVADLIVASGSEQQLESHRREITALFCDLRGFTGFSESADPEDVMALLRDYHAAIGAIIIKYSGTLERYAGDGVMVVFNDPVPVENPALQAVLMALELRGAIGALTEKWRRLGHDIGFGIGIAHGYATLGTIGFEGRFDYAAIGTVSNVASRLCDEAKPGQILISPRVLMAIEDAVTVEPVGEFALKGIRRPLAAYNVVAAKSAN
jgi:GAF domain-containing protein